MLCVAFAAKGAGKQTFNALTLTRLSGLHHKERWLAFGASLAEEETIKVSAERCTVAPSTAHRWRHLFLVALRQQATGPACRNYGGGRDLPVGESQEPAADGAPAPAGAILAATDRSGSTMDYRLAAVNAANLKRVLAPVVRPMPYWSASPIAVIRLWPEPLNIPTRASMPQPERGSAPLYQP